MREQVTAYARKYRYLQQEHDEVAKRLSAVERILKQYDCSTSGELLAEAAQAEADLDRFYQSEGTPTICLQACLHVCLTACLPAFFASKLLALLQIHLPCDWPSELMLLYIAFILARSKTLMRHYLSVAAINFLLAVRDPDLPNYITKTV